MNNKNFFILACLARSYDKYHNKECLIHLVCSIFYTTDFSINSKVPLKDSITIRLVEDTDILFDVRQHDGKFFEIIINIYYFLGLIEKSDVQMSKFVSLLFGNYDSKEKELSNFNLSNVLFVFENISWFKIMYLFKLVKVQISGGSISKRHVLSNVKFCLVRYLAILGFDLSKVNENFGVLSNELRISDDNLEDSLLKLERSFLVEIISSFLENIKKKNQRLKLMN